MVVSGMSLPKHPCLVELGVIPHKRIQKNEVAQALSDAATAITSAISTNVQWASSTNSDSYVIERRSRLYRQLSELWELQSISLLTEDEYKIEKDSIMKLLTHNSIVCYCTCLLSCNSCVLITYMLQVCLICCLCCIYVHVISISLHRYYW